LAGQSTRKHVPRNKGRALNNESSEMLGFVALRLAFQTICSSGMKEFKK